MKILLSCLCAALILGIGPAARACRFCQMVASDPESARLSGQVQGQDFPLEGVVNQYQPAAPAANLVAPPPAASVATKISDLPTTVIRRAVTPPPVMAAMKSAPVKATTVTPAPSSHLADAGLLGLAAAGGLFCWRTRRTPAPQV